MTTSFKLEATVKANDCIPVRKYRSENTGLTVIVADIEGPVVNGYFALSTEAHDDDGLPHTLEHLIFLGSELYPYKGVLDLIANRCLASGTNAWTDTDHTCYTMTTAGSEGFLSLLPIYLDHILYPTLTDAGYITEVHHVSGDGEDGGVVYCEMQGRENTGESRVHLEMLRAIYPNSGYSAETGGIMRNLRESTSNEKVRAYHAQFYRPDNLTVIITGKVEPEAVFEALADLEKRIESKGALTPFERPWMSPVAPLTESKDIKIMYSSDEEDCGIVNVAYRGPLARTEYRTLTACSLLMRYLSDTSVSPLQRELVETDDPHASKISFNIGENSESLLYFSFENVPLEKIDKVYEKYSSVLMNIAEGKERICMQRLGTVIDKAIVEALSSIESNPHDDIAFHSIGYILYGDSEEHFDDHLNSNRQYRELKGKDETFWIDLLKKYFIDGKRVVVRAVPDIEEKTKAAKEELDRIEQQRAALGKDGLAKKDAELLAAMQENERPPPNSMLTQVDVPSVEKINFHGLKIYKRGAASPPGLDLNVLPIYAEAYDLNSNFVYMILSLNTESVPLELRPYLLLLLELFTESPILRNGELVPYEQVVAEMEADTVTTGTRIGLEVNSRFSTGPFSNTISILIQVEPQKYAKGAAWMEEILHFTQFTTNRIRVTAAKMANDVAQAKRNGNATARALLKAIYYKEGTNARLVSLMRQYKFLSALLEKLEKPEEAQRIVDDLNKVRSIITRADNVALHIAANWSKLAASGVDLLTPWKTFMNDVDTVPNTLKIIPDYELINLAGNVEGATGVVLGLGCVESAFLLHAAPAINDFNDPDLPALNVFLQYLLQLEGPLWRQIRGAGLAYGYSITPRPHEGLLYMALFRATNVVAAFKEAKSIIETQLQEGATWDDTLLESARSSLIFEIIEREKSVGDVVVQALLYTFKKTSADYNKTLVKQINSVTKDDLTRVGQKYVAALFSNKARTSIVCHPDKASDIAAAFEQLGHPLKTETSLEDSVLA